MIRKPASAFQRAVAVCRKLGSPEMLARALYSLGIIAETRAELKEGKRSAKNYVLLRQKVATRA